MVVRLHVRGPAERRSQVVDGALRVVHVIVESRAQRLVDSVQHVAAATSGLLTELVPVVSAEVSGKARPWLGGAEGADLGVGFRVVIVVPP